MSKPILRDRALQHLPVDLPPRPQPAPPQQQCTPLRIEIYNGQTRVNTQEYAATCDARPGEVTRDEARQALQQEMQYHDEAPSHHIPLRDLRFRIGTSPFLSLDQVLSRAGLRRAR